MGLDAGLDLPSELVRIDDRLPREVLSMFGSESITLPHAELFQSISNLSTYDYLRSDCNSPITSVIRSNLDADVRILHSNLDLAGTLSHPADGLRVLLTNVDMGALAGSQFWTYEIALYLIGRGASVLVYAPVLGDMALIAKAHGVCVTSKAEDAHRFQPDIIHLQHYPVMSELLRLLDAGIPRLRFIHGLLPWQEAPGEGRTGAYGAVSAHAKAKIHLVTGTPWEQIAQVPNFFDDKRFPPLPTRVETRRAILLSSRTSTQNRELLREKLSRFGMELDHVGVGGVVTNSPELLLRRYQLAFAVGRSAIEAQASGLKTILWDDGVIGPAVTPELFWSCVAVNFALAANVLPWTTISDQRADEWLSFQIALAACKPVSITSLTRRVLSLDNVGRLLVEKYKELLA